MPGESAASVRSIERAFVLAERLARGRPESAWLSLDRFSPDLDCLSWIARARGLEVPGLVPGLEASRCPVSDRLKHK